MKSRTRIHCIYFDGSFFLKEMKISMCDDEDKIFTQSHGNEKKSAIFKFYFSHLYQAMKLILTDKLHFEVISNG